ncbi:MAG: outer membrane lipoprotein carrier protein LolA [Vicinamibacterales bacterium]
MACLRWRTVTSAVVVVAVNLAVPAGARQPSLAAAELAQRIQARYDRINDFAGSFTQTYEGGVLRTRTTERGTLVIKRPGRMRWVYTSPEKKEFVSNGVKVYAYFPADRQVMVSDAPTGADTTPALFLTGRADLVRDFTASAMAVPGAAPGLLGLKLVAKRPDPDFEWLAIAVDPAGYQIRHLVALDRQGGRSTFTFSDLKENRRPPDTLFEFRIPRGVDVITNDPRSH